MNWNASHDRQQSRQRTPGRKRGFTLVELTLAVTLAAVFCAILAPILIGITHQRRAIVQEQLALTHLANVLEDLTLCPPDEWDAHLAKHLESMPETVRQQLPQARLEIFRTDEPGPIPASRITCQIRWQNRQGQTTKPLTLTGWNHQTPEGQP